MIFRACQGPKSTLGACKTLIPQNYGNDAGFGESRQKHLPPTWSVSTNRHAGDDGGFPGPRLTAWRPGIPRDQRGTWVLAGF